MVVVERSWRVAVVTVLSGCFSMGFSFRGGAEIYNGGKVSVDLSVVMRDSSTRLLLKSFEPGERFAMRESLDIRSIIVEHDGVRTQLEESNLVEQQRGLPPTKQVWLFDGVRVCVVSASAFKADAGMKCPP